MSRRSEHRRGRAGSAGAAGLQDFGLRLAFDAVCVDNECLRLVSVIDCKLVVLGIEM